MRAWKGSKFGLEWFAVVGGVDVDVVATVRWGMYSVLLRIQVAQM